MEVVTKLETDSFSAIENLLKILQERDGILQEALSSDRFDPR